RIENLALAEPVDTPEGGAFGEMLGFEALTLCPIDTRCIDASLLRTDEIAWLDQYHALVRSRLSPLVSGDAKAWLLKRTEPAGAGGLHGRPPPRHRCRLGGTKIEAILLDAGGHERWRERVASPRGDYDAALQAIAGLVARAKQAAGGAPCTIGVGAPGNVTQ